MSAAAVSDPGPYEDDGLPPIPVDVLQGPRGDALTAPVLATLLSNPNNDFKTHSQATSLNNNGVNQHQVSTCGDWKTRTNLLSNLAGGCYINFHSENLYCNVQTYEGLDPSYIWTDFDEGGNGTPFDC